MTRPTNPRLVAWDHAIETLDHVRAVLPDALDGMRDARRGYPGSSLGSSGRGATGSPVEAAAMHPDHGGAALRSLDDILRRLTTLSDEAYRLTVVGTWAPRPPAPKDLRETEAANVAECAHHRQLVATHEPVHVRGTAGGVLDEPMPLCRWCWDYTRQSGALPPRGAMLDRQAGRRVLVRRQPSRA